MKATRNASASGTETANSQTASAETSSSSEERPVEQDAEAAPSYEAVLPSTLAAPRPDEKPTEEQSGPTAGKESFGEAAEPTEPEALPLEKPELAAAPNGPKRRMFLIEEERASYQPIERSEEGLVIAETDKALPESGHNVNYRLYLRPRAMEQIAQHIGWGGDTEANQVEQGGILVGDVFYDLERGTTYGVVEEAVPGWLANGSMAFLRFDHRTWKAMLDQVDGMYQEEEGRDLQVIGWYHTHPRRLSVFMSGTDRATQRRLFSKDWQFAIVMNPQKERWRAFHGRDAEECLGFVLAE